MEIVLYDNIEENKGNVDVEEVKEYVIKLKRMLDDIFESFGEDDEYTKEEIIREFLENYEQGYLEGLASKKIGNRIIRFKSYKNIIKAFKNKELFKYLIKKAKELEATNSEGMVETDTVNEDCMIALIRLVLRVNPKANDINIIEAIKRIKSNEGNELKQILINQIRSCVFFLEEYGIIDEYIDAANSQLEKLNLGQLKYMKRNPIADEIYENGQLVENTEDIGLFEAIDEEYLMNLSVEDLMTMTLFWKAKYAEARIRIEAALGVIKGLDLFEKDESYIESIDDDTITSIVALNETLLQFCMNNTEITPEMEEEYIKYIIEHGFHKTAELKKAIEEFRLINEDSSNIAFDLNFLQFELIELLLSKELKLRKWGICEEPGEDDLKERYFTLVIDNSNFRGPLMMGVPKSLVTEDEFKKIPQYKAKVNDDYSNVMALICMPVTPEYMEILKKIYQKDPSSELVASLLGKKAKDLVER